MDIIATDTFGRSVKLTRQKISQVLLRCVSELKSAHVYIHEPKMVIIYRIKDKQLWLIVVEELNDTENSPLKPIYRVTFRDEEIEAAIDLFFALIKSQRKDYEHSMYKKLGKFVIFKHKNGDIHEIFRRSVGYGPVRGRRKTATQKGKEGSQSCKKIRR